VAHSYLFVRRPRCVGNTTTARLLAKSLLLAPRARAPRRADVHGGARDAGNLRWDVIEIDCALSNRGIGDRTLRETSSTRRPAAATKVYINDDVHHLTEAAFTRCSDAGGAARARCSCWPRPIRATSRPPVLSPPLTALRLSA